MNNKSVIVFDDCKKCGSNVEFYFYPNNPSRRRCRLCVLKARKNRYSNKSLREHDLKYQEKWVLENPDKVEEYQKTIIEKERIKRQSISKIHNKLVLSFIEDNKDFLIRLFKHFEIEYSDDHIKKALKNSNVELSNFKNIIIKFCFNKFYQKVKATIMWKESSLMKYRLRIRETYKDAPEEIKEKIRKESVIISKYEAKKIIKEKIALYESI